LAIEPKTLTEVKLSATYPLHTARYHSGKFTAYELALSLRPDSYLSHGTAAFLHGVATNQPDFIYANQEQCAKEQSGSLTQAALNKAFSLKQRQSNFIVSHDQTKIMLLSGKHTNRLGVQKIVAGYAGGTENVLQNYRRAIQETSAEHLAEMLNKLDYVLSLPSSYRFLFTESGTRSRTPCES
jgi:hypothetical protein